ncbi:MAG: hypothetical protein FWG55_02005 [Candidatus Bathyarchaeota archaeon]|nr:hypothetical protein [Candidatus Termiticorpusculum sp.]
MITADDIVLLINFIGNCKKVEGRTRIQKDICILKYEDKIPFNFDFASNYYGPYSHSLSETIDVLIAADLLTENITTLKTGFKRYDYKLTKAGQKMYAANKNLIEHDFPVLKSKALKLCTLTIADVTTRAKNCSGIPSLDRKKAK